MTIEEKHDEIAQYCVGRSCTECPLFRLKEACHPPNDAIIERNFKLVSAMPDYRGKKEEPTVTKEMLDKAKETAEELLNHEDIINHPSHYNRDGAMESIDEMVLIFGKEAVMHFCLCNVWKYRYRSADKNGVEDLKKSDWYMRKYRELQGVN